MKSAFRGGARSETLNPDPVTELPLTPPAEEDEEEAAISPRPSLFCLVSRSTNRKSAAASKTWKLAGLPVPVLHPARSHAAPHLQQLLSVSLQMCFCFRNTASDLNQQWLSIRLPVQHKPGRLSHTLFSALLLRGIGCTLCHDGVLKLVTYLSHSKKAVTWHL